MVWDGVDVAVFIVARQAINDYKNSDAAKASRQRWKALVEIYTTEKSYNAALELTIKCDACARPVRVYSYTCVARAGTICARWNAHRSSPTRA